MYLKNGRVIINRIRSFVTKINIQSSLRKINFSLRKALQIYSSTLFLSFLSLFLFSVQNSLFRRWKIFEISFIRRKGKKHLLIDFQHAKLYGKHIASYKKIERNAILPYGYDIASLIFISINRMNVQSPSMNTFCNISTNSSNRWQNISTRQRMMRPLKANIFNFAI